MPTSGRLRRPPRPRRPPPTGPASTRGGGCVAVSTTAEVDLFFENDLGVDLSGIPTSYTFDVRSLPKIQIGLDPIELEPITVNPLDVSVRIKEIPSIRTHVPALFTLGLSVLGYELLCARLCGEAQLITEPYEPNPCEHCGKPHRTATPVPVPVPNEPTPGVPK